MATEASVTLNDFSAERTLLWLALTLTPGIGAGRGRRLVELFNGIERLFRASLTELEAAGLPGAAAQSLALGKSLELAGDELDRAKASGAHVVGQDDPGYPNPAKPEPNRKCFTMPQ
jgi:DNA processing protein